VIVVLSGIVSEHRPRTRLLKFTSYLTAIVQRFTSNCIFSRFALLAFPKVSQHNLLRLIEFRCRMFNPLLAIELVDSDSLVACASAKGGIRFTDHGANYQSFYKAHGLSFH